jgi:hypothetical protein
MHREVSFALIKTAAKLSLYVQATTGHVAPSKKLAIHAAAVA